MFTGIVEELGTVVALTPSGDSMVLELAGSTVLEGTGLGDSIAVNGCCLTVTSLVTAPSGEPTGWTVDVMAESLARTSLGSLVEGSVVNLERAMALGDRLGGHLVQGHVDGVGRVLSRTPGDAWERVEISLPSALSRYLVDQGSITVDGVSLTVVEALPDSFTVSLIPETLARTTLGIRAVGDPVNLEADVIAKHVEKLMRGHLPSPAQGAGGAA